VLSIIEFVLKIVVSSSEINNLHGKYKRKCRDTV
jgi:hypothetical protein